MTRNNMLNTKFNGDVEAYKAFMSEIASKGGRAKVPKGTAMWSAAKRRKVGSKGGRARHENSQV